MGAGGWVPSNQPLGVPKFGDAQIRFAWISLDLLQHDLSRVRGPSLGLDSGIPFEKTGPNKSRTGLHLCNCALVLLPRLGRF